jgi:hypothetical protein
MPQEVALDDSEMRNITSQTVDVVDEYNFEQML